MSATQLAQKSCSAGRELAAETAGAAGPAFEGAANQVAGCGTQTARDRVRSKLDNQGRRFALQGDRGMRSGFGLWAPGLVRFAGGHASWILGTGKCSDRSGRIRHHR